jgi:hypothetical protein
MLSWANPGAAFGDEMRDASRQRADLHPAELIRAILRGAKLESPEVFPSQLAQARSLERRNPARRHGA